MKNYRLECIQSVTVLTGRKNPRFPDDPTIRHIVRQALQILRRGPLKGQTLNDKTHVSWLNTQIRALLTELRKLPSSSFLYRRGRSIDESSYLYVLSDIGAQWSVEELTRAFALLTFFYLDHACACSKSSHEASEFVDLARRSVERASTLEMFISKRKVPGDFPKLVRKLATPWGRSLVAAESARMKHERELGAQKRQAIEAAKAYLSKRPRLPITEVAEHVADVLSRSGPWRGTEREPAHIYRSIYNWLRQAKKQGQLS